MIPQAFTTRDMSEAYKWLHTLPPSVRDEMKSMEQVVMLYLKAKRLGGGLPSKEDLESLKATNTVAPVEISKSSQEFQKTLKNLKTELDRFDFVPNSASQEPVQEQQTRHIEIAPASVTHIKSVHEDSGHQSTNVLTAARMDPKSRQIINEIRESLNLSSDLEVLRMSLVLAHKTLKDLLK